MTARTGQSPRPMPRAALLALAYLAFVSLGLPDTVLGVAFPSLRATFGLPHAALGAPLGAAATTYFLSGVFAGRLIATLGIGRLLAASTVLVSAGVAGCALSPLFAVFLLCAALIGFGSGAIDAALNAHAAHNFGAGHMTWMHASYSVGAALGPAIMTATLARGAPWRAGYAVIAAALGALALAFTATRTRWTDGATPPAREGATNTGWRALRQGRVRLQLATFFVYCGIETGAGQWSYTVLTEQRGVGPVPAGTLVSLYWASLLAGRVLLGFVVERTGPVRLLRGATGAALAGALLFALPGQPPLVAAAGLALLGFALAPVYPGLMASTPSRAGAAAGHVVGYSVSAGTLGAASLPAAAGLVAQGAGLAVVAPWIAGCALLLVVLHEALVRAAARGAMEAATDQPAAG